MSEIIVNMKTDYLKIKGGEYKQDLIRCEDCPWHEPYNNDDHGRCQITGCQVYPDDFCSYAEEKQ